MLIACDLGMRARLIDESIESATNEKKLLVSVRFLLAGGILPILLSATKVASMSESKLDDELIRWRTPTNQFFKRT